MSSEPVSRGDLQRFDLSWVLSNVTIFTGNKRPRIRQFLTLKSGEKMVKKLISIRWLWIK
jgi:hypothetical protein